MFRLSIARGPSGDTGTFGGAVLFEDDAAIGNWHSLELGWHQNEQDYSCIPPGVYPAQAVHSSKFGRTIYLLLGVPGRTACELHPANWAGDIRKGLKSDLEGCTALGLDVGPLQPKGYAEQMAVLHSGDALDELFKLTGGADMEVEYGWTPGTDPGDWPPTATA